MTIEVLYPELYIYGDMFNVSYLEQCLPNAKFVHTKINDEPLFVSNPVDLIYMGSIPDIYQEKILPRLAKYASKIKSLVESGTFFLVTGNALDLFGNSICNEECSVSGLGIFDFDVKKSYKTRHNSWFRGIFNGIDIIGSKSQFSFIYTDNISNKFIDIFAGFGYNRQKNYEGIHKNNFYGTKLLGPFLILNPLFTEYLLKEMGLNVTMPNIEKMLWAYREKLKDLSEPDSINFSEVLVTRNSKNQIG